MADPAEVCDEQLVDRARAGDELALAALLTRYRGLARARARSYFLVGGDREDVLQEAMIGLYQAVRDFDGGRGCSFATFADVCITRHVISAVKAATRHKHGPLNTSVSLALPVHGDRHLADTIALPAATDPAELVISAQRIRNLQAHLDRELSALEVDVLRLWLDGRSYAEIAAVLDRQVKAVDNALQRVKRKLDAHLRDRELAEAG